MSTDYSIEMDIIFQKDATQEELASALLPILSAIELKDDDVAKLITLAHEKSKISRAKFFPVEDIGFFDHPSDEDLFILSIYACGELSSDTHAMLSDAIYDGLDDVINLAHIELRDHDTGDLENAITHLWGGSPEAVFKARREHSIRSALENFTTHDFSETEIDTIKELLAQMQSVELESEDEDENSRERQRG